MLVNFKGQINISDLTDQELGKLHAALWNEMSARSVAKYEAGEYPTVNDEEIQLFKTGRRVDAIQAYRLRARGLLACGLPAMGLAETKQIVEHAYEKAMKDAREARNDND